MHHRAIRLCGLVTLALAMLMPEVALAAWDNSSVYHYFPDLAVSLPPNIASLKVAPAQAHTFPYVHGLVNWPVTVRVHIGPGNQVSFLTPPALPTMVSELLFQGILVEVSSDLAPSSARLRFVEVDASQQSSATLSTSPLYPTLLYLVQLKKLPLGQSTFTLALTTAQGAPIGQLPLSITTTPPAYLNLTVNDMVNGLPTPARVAIAGNGLFAYSDQAFPIYDDFWGTIDYQKSFGDQTWPATVPSRSYYTRGQTSTIAVRPGTIDLIVSKGLDYARYQETLSLAAGQTASRIVNLQQVYDLPAAGWYSVDDHLHVPRNGTTDDDIVDWCAAEDVNFANTSQMGDSAALYFLQSTWGPASEHVKGRYRLRAGQEDPRTTERGHALMLGNLTTHWDPSRYYIYEDVFGFTHMDGGLAGYAHNGFAVEAERGLAIDAPLGMVDFIEIYFQSPAAMITSVLYDWYNLGIKQAVLAGSDFPYDPLGKPLLGSMRAHVYLGPGNLSFANIAAATLQGATYATNGPIVDFTVNGSLPGSELALSGMQTLDIQVHARLNPTLGDQLSTIQIISQGDVIAQKTIAPGEEHDATLSFPYQTNQSCWIAARVDGLLTGAHTTAVYVTIDGKKFWRANELATRVPYMTSLLDEVENLIAVGTVPASQATDLQNYIDQSRAVLLGMLACPTLSLSPLAAPAAAGAPYSAALASPNGYAPLVFSVTSGALPAGMTLSSAGVLSGTPTLPGPYTFTVQVADVLGCSGTQAFTLDVLAMDGSVCAAANECASDLCVDGVCCDSPCGAGACDACSVAAGATADGVCEMLSGAACDDSDGCTLVDTCQAGLCVGSSAAVCAASDECHVAGACDPQSGQCTDPAAPDGTSCLGGTCQAGTCVPDQTASSTTVASSSSTTAASGGGGAATSGSSAAATTGNATNATSNGSAGGGGDGAGGQTTDGADASAGCGCRAAGSVERGPRPFALALLVAGGFLARGRRRRPEASGARRS